MAKRQLQIILLGNQSTGKTTMVKRFVDKNFDEDHLSKLGLDFATTTYTTEDGEQIPVKIWDTAGQERFKTLTQSFYRKADGILLTFDITDEQSFKDVRNWIDSVNKHASENSAKVLVANKQNLDSERKVTTQQI